MARQDSTSTSPSEADAHDHEIREYQHHLVLAEQKAQEDYDKTLIFLAGGALAISFAFVDTIAAGPPFDAVILLTLSWSGWSSSLATILGSFWLSRLALRRALVDSLNGTTGDPNNPGGGLATATQWANAIAGILFLIGLVLMGIFVILNIETSMPPQS